MFTISAQHKLKLFGIALAVPLSLVLTLMAVMDLPPVQASHHTAMMPHTPHESSSGPALQRSLTDPSAPSGGVDVSISGSAFDPAVITITAGTVVTWTNLDAIAHTTTSDAGSSDPWNSGSLGQNGIFTKTFNTPGVYGYHCAIHFLSMFGTVVVLAPQSPIALNVTGPSGGVADVAHTFAATVSPITTTQPITYFWQATGQTPVTHTNKGLSDTLAFTWSAANLGPQLITVTAENSAGSVSTAYTITIVPPAGAGVTDVSIVDFAFQPQVITIDVGSTVRWINTGLSMHTTTSDVSSPETWNSGNLDPGEVFTRTFNTPGMYDYHCAIHSFMTGTVIVLAPQAPLEVSVTGPSGGAANIPYTFTATVSPITTTQPITYIWQATGQTTMTRTDKGLSDTLAFTWPAPDVGAQLITVTAVNSVGNISTTHAINIVPPSNVYLPIVLR